MSKKMLKRSLALGALMAFVITGSAMAANVTIGETLTGAITDKTEIVGTGSESITIIGTPNASSNPSVSSGYITKVEDIGTITYKGDWGTGSQANANIATVWGKGDLVFNNIGKITTEGTIGGETVFFHAFGAKIDFKNIGSIEINPESGNVFFAQNVTKGDKDYSGNIVVEADTINVKSGGSAVQASNYLKDTDASASVTLTAKNITLESSQDSACVTVFNKYQGNVYNNKGNISINADETLSITGSTAVNAQYGKDSKNTAKVELHAKNINIVNNGIEYLYAIRARDFAEISVNAKDEANITGDVEVLRNSVVDISAAAANINGTMVVDGTSTLDLSNVKDLVLVGLEVDNTDAAVQVAEGGVLNVNTSGTLAIDQAEVGTYKVVDGVGNNVMWANENLAYDRTALFAEGTVADNIYSVTYTTADKMTDEQKETAGKEYIAATGGEELAVPDLVGSAAGAGSIMENTAPGAKEFLAAVSSNPNMLKETKAAVINSAAQLAEAGGNAGTAASVANNVSSVTTGRMSFNGDNKGGHGVGLFEEGSGAAVWAQYMHGKDDATDMPMDGGATSYESEYDGIVVGVDFKKVGKFQSGIAFNYGEGDSTGFTSAAKTQSDYDFWGIGYYGNIRNEDTNFIFDVNYAKSDSDVTQNNAGASAAIEASPETTTWSAGVKVEKLYQNNNVQIVPYTGLRYMSSDTKEYQSNVGGDTLFNYAPERQDIWLLPLGVTIKQEVVNDNGWVVTPKVDLSYIWAFGDTDSNMSVSIPGIAASNDTLGFTVMDDGSFLGLVGVEAKLDDWTFGVSYSYQKGDYAESKKWFVDAKYSF